MKRTLLILSRALTTVLVILVMALILAALFLGSVFGVVYLAKQSVIFGYLLLAAVMLMGIILICVALYEAAKEVYRWIRNNLF